MSQVRVRIAPSPTGDPHVGTPYMALFNLIFARHHRGKFILRIEDTDQTRSRPEYEKNIFESLQWCGILWDEGPDIGGPYGPYRQSERTDIYVKHCKQLVDNGKAYYCFATPQELTEMRELAKQLGKRIGYDRRYRNLSPEEIRQRLERNAPYTIRLKVPLTGECVFEDALKGRISTPMQDIDDQILLKSDGFPTYHLANVVDDHLMKITHVIRGDEWVSSTPKHILLYEAFGWTPPTFLHMPLLLGKDGKKLSKRKNPTSVFYYRDSGYLQNAFINFLSLMGYSMPNDLEIYTIDDVIANFDIRRIGTSGAFFDINKLDWINQHYLIHSIPKDKLWNAIKSWGFSDNHMQKLMPMCHTRIKTFGDFIDLCGFLFINHVNLDLSLLTPGNITPETACALLQTLIWQMEENANFQGSGLEAASREVAKAFKVNHKKIVMRILFAAITGKHFGPPLFDSVDILGKPKTQARLLKAIEFLGGLSNKKLTLLTKSWDAKNCETLVQKND